MDELKALMSLAKSMGVHARYTDGLGRAVTVAPETLLRVCAAAGAPVASWHDAADALRARAEAASAELVPPVLIAWGGTLQPITAGGDGPVAARLHVEGLGEVALGGPDGAVATTSTLPFGYHRLVVERGGRVAESTVVSAPHAAWRRDDGGRRWGISAHLAALRSARSRAVGDLRDLLTACEWAGGMGADVVALLPLLPTFNASPPEPSPYSPVSRLFWSELLLDVGDGHYGGPPSHTLDVTRADQEVRAALAGFAAPDPQAVDAELARYAQFRGAQARLGRNWRDWPAAAKSGVLAPELVDGAEERFHLTAQLLARQQLRQLRQRLDPLGIRLGLDLAVGVHPDGYDPWSRQSLFADGMSVGAPPDAGFPSGQDWGFAPVIPTMSRHEGHRYLAASIAHQAGLAGLLRVDHVMAWTRLYWIPHGLGLHEGTYVSYPAEELFAVLCLESERSRCEIVGENLGTVPPEIDAALPRRRIWGMYLAQFAASDLTGMSAPTAADVALIGTHDTPTFAGWLAGDDIAERVQYGLLAADDAPSVAAARARDVQRLVARVSGGAPNAHALLAELLAWLGRSPSPLVIAWLEDCWLEGEAINLPGTPSSVRPNWQRPMRRLLEDVMHDPAVAALLAHLRDARLEQPASSDLSRA